METQIKNNIIELERTSSTFIVGTRFGRNLTRSCTTSAMFRMFVLGLVQALNERQLKHLVDISYTALKGEEAAKQLVDGGNRA